MPALRSSGVTRRSVDATTITLPSGRSVPLSTDLATLITETQPHVLLDATTAEAAAGKRPHRPHPRRPSGHRHDRTIASGHRDYRAGSARSGGWAPPSCPTLPSARQCCSTSPASLPNTTSTGPRSSSYITKKRPTPLPARRCTSPARWLPGEVETFERAETAKYTLDDVRAGQQGRRRYSQRPAARFRRAPRGDLWRPRPNVDPAARLYEPRIVPPRRPRLAPLRAHQHRCHGRTGQATRSGVA